MSYKFKRSDFIYIDSHSHFFPERLFKAIWNFWDLKYKPIFPLWNIKYKFGGNVEKMVSFLHERQVKNYVTLNYAHKASVAEKLNEWTHDFCNKHPEAISFGAVYPENGCLEYTEKALNEYNFHGLKLQLLVTDFYIDDEKLMPIYKLIKELDKIIVIHAGTAPGPSPYVGIKHFKKFIEKFPDIKCQISHLGGFEYRKFLQLLQEHSNFYLDTTMIFIEHDVFDDQIEKKLGGLENLKMILEENKDKILWGTDFPNIPYDYDLAKDSLLRFNLSKDFYKKVFHDNAKKLYQL
ncbi:MAG: amidohydrolase family protein [Candidatus Helarchaeota archaeon]